MSVSKTILVGRVGKEVEARTLDDGTCVANFSLATTESYKDKASGEKKETTEWHNIVLWGKVAEIAQQYVKKGDLIFIEGKNKTRKWEKDGITRYTTEVVANELRMLGGKSGSQGSDASSSSDDDNQELPF